MEMSLDDGRQEGRQASHKITDQDIERCRGLKQLYYYRLIALWVVCEAMLGGIIHGFKIPVSGLIVGSCSVLCISLIAYYQPKKGCILKAAVIVAIFKMMLSPQAPPTAYIAVFFQGLMGEVLFWKRKMYPLSCFLLGVITLLESAMQRIIILTVIYGNDLWLAINNFMNGCSALLISAYILLHLIVGIAIGILAASLPNKIHFWIKQDKEYLIDNINQQAETVLPLRKRKRLKKKIFFIWIVLLLLYIQSNYAFGPALLPSHIALHILLRSLLVMLSCYFFLVPFCNLVLKKFLEKKKNIEYESIKQVLDLLPNTKQLIEKSWQLAGKKSGAKRARRVLLCCKIILLNTFHSAYA
jgi:hypothetical protein